MLPPDYSATSGDMGEQPAVLQIEDTEPAGLPIPDSMHIEVHEQAEQQESPGENAAAEQVFMYLQASLQAAHVGRCSTV